jgi:hypothetical protein
MVDPKVLIVMILLGAGYGTYEGAVKPAAVKVAHVTKAGVTKVVHFVTRHQEKP